MEKILVYYVDEKAPTITMQKLTGGIIAVIVVVSLIVLAGLLVLVSVCRFTFKWSMCACTCGLTVPLYFSSFLHGGRRPSTVKHRLVLIYFIIQTVVLYPKGSKLLFDTLPSVLAAQRDGDHVLKLLMMSHVLESDTGTCPCWSIDLFSALHVIFSYWENCVCYMLATVVFKQCCGYVLLFNEGSFSLDQHFNIVQFVTCKFLIKFVKCHAVCFFLNLLRS